MANEHWYALKVRSGFATVVAERLRRLNLEVFVPEPSLASSQESRSTANYLYCRFELGNRQSVMNVPGVMDVLGTPAPTPIDGEMPGVQPATRFRF